MEILLDMLAQKTAETTLQDSEIERLRLGHETGQLHRLETGQLHRLETGQLHRLETGQPHRGRMI